MLKVARWLLAAAIVCRTDGRTICLPFRLFPTVPHVAAQTLSGTKLLLPSKQSLCLWIRFRDFVLVLPPAGHRKLSRAEDDSILVDILFRWTTSPSYALDHLCQTWRWWLMCDGISATLNWIAWEFVWYSWWSVNFIATSIQEVNSQFGADDKW